MTSERRQLAEALMEEINSLIERAEEIPKDWLDEKCEPLSMGRARRARRLVEAYNSNKGKRFPLYALDILAKRPTAYDFEEYRGQIIFKSPSRNRTSVTVKWDDGKFNSFRHDNVNSLKLLIDDILDQEPSKIETGRSGGWIYLAQNESMPELVKIGLTTTSINQRMKELSGTSVPTPFYAVGSFRIEHNVLKAESLLHDAFKSNRIHQRREFFKCDDLADTFVVAHALIAKNFRGFYEIDRAPQEKFSQQ